MTNITSDSKKLVLLDCTFRDGGYYNDWLFHENIINKYLMAMSSSFINYVELGFRFKSKKGFKGSTAYTSDNFLRKLNIPKNLNIGVMINASDLVDRNSFKSVVKQLFPEDKSTSRLDFVRIACHFKELDIALEASKLLYELGFKVGLNLMQISERSEDEILFFINESKKFPIEVIYCADSIGGLNNMDVIKIYKIFKEHCDHIPYGFHAHDNLNLALSNSLCAIENGATWIDSTMSGMGRGPGNTRTEELVLELSSNFTNRFDLTLLFDLIYSEFYPLKNYYQWGSNIFYYMSGKWGVHPSYVQTMLVDSRFNALDILAVLEYLRNKPTRASFNRDLLFSQSRVPQISNSTNWSPKELFSDRDVLILGNGQSILEHSSALNDFIFKYNPIVIALNYNSELHNMQINVRLSSHPLRVHSNINQFINEKNTLVIPFSYLDKIEIDMLSENTNIKNFSFEISDGKFELEKDLCKLPSNLTLAYALGIVMKGNCKNIFLAGIDGYPTGDSRNTILLEIFNSFYESFPNKEIKSLTGTNIHNLTVNSVYGY